MFRFKIDGEINLSVLLGVVSVVLAAVAIVLTLMLA